MLIRTFIATHLVYGKTDDVQNLYSAESNYLALRMGDQEGIDSYQLRFKANLSALTEAAYRADKMDRTPDEDMQIVHFVNTLSNRYSEFKSDWLRKLPEIKEQEQLTTLQKVYERVISFGPDIRSMKHTSTNYRGVFVTQRGNRKGGGGGRGDSNRGGRTSTKGGGRGACAICKEHGHWKNECPNRKTDEEKQIDKAVNEVTFESKEKTA